MRRFLQARERSVAEILSPQYRFHVPSFQRPYAWTLEESGRLLADFQTAMYDMTPWLDTTPPYFLGTIVVVKRSFIPDAMVVDGQQRLTTLTILLAVLRDLEPEGTDRLQPHILYQYQEGGDMDEGPVRPRPLDQRFFFENIQTRGRTLLLEEDTQVENDAQANMLANAVRLRRQLQEMPAEERRRLTDYVLERCYLVEISAPHEEQAYQIFTVMNDRGLDLKENDILKSETLGRIPADRQPYFAHQWEVLEAELGRDRFAELFGHLRMIHSPDPSRRSLIADLRESLDPAGDPERFITDELRPKGEVFQDIIAENLHATARQDEIRGYLRVLNRLNNKDWIPTAILFFSAARRRAEESYLFLRALDRLAYALFIQSADNKTRAARYKRTIQAIKEGGDKEGGDMDAILESMALAPHDRRVTLEVLQGNLYSKERVRLPVLLRIDQHLAETNAWYDTREITVEHVLPRNPPPGSPWLELFPDGKERRRLTDKLGNLALLSRHKNQQAANYDFERKKHEYFAKGGVTPFALTTQILAESTWTPEIVKARQERLVDAARELWGL